MGRVLARLPPRATTGAITPRALLHSAERVMRSHYRRPLPEGQIPFASPEGRTLFGEAMQDGTTEGFFPLIEQFHTQADPAYCGLASLVMALNALGVDPGRLWRGPWRWFSEELLDCCTPLEKVQLSGVSMDELACLARCNGAEASIFRPNGSGSSEFRELVRRAFSSLEEPVVVIASYSRQGLEQTGEGHFSPIGAYHARRDLVLVLDVARFKYPPHWVPLERLFNAMHHLDPTTGRSRGWITLRRGPQPGSLRYFIICREGLGIGAALEALVSNTRAALRTIEPQALGAVIERAARSAAQSSVFDTLELRRLEAFEHQDLFESLRSMLRATALYAHVREYTRDYAELATAWLFSAPAELWAELPPPLGSKLAALVDPAGLPEALALEVAHLRSQVEFVLDHARAFRDRAGPSLLPS